MKNKSALILTIAGATLTGTGLILTVRGIMLAMEMSRYRNTGANIPGILFLLLMLACGVAVLVTGIRKIKATR
jgi:hypothetical protein